jgi:hypothetical protein
MKHNKILDKLAARHLVESIEEDVARLVWLAMCPPADGVAAYVMPRLLPRWNCVLNAGKDEVADLYKQKTFLALAVVLRKYGVADKAITKKALAAIDKLNKAVALSGDFFRKTDRIKALIESEPEPLKRRPSYRDSLTFYRAGDVVSIQLGDLYYAAYVHEILRFNEAPLIELYDAVFDRRPVLEEVLGKRAKGGYYNDGSERVEKFSVAGMRNVPDLANQFVLIGSGIKEVPSTSHLKEPVGLYSVMDLFGLLAAMQRMFREREV